MKHKKLKVFFFLSFFGAFLVFGDIGSLFEGHSRCLGSFIFIF
jgi:hypothetical protein